MYTKKIFLAIATVHGSTLANHQDKYHWENAGTLGWYISLFKPPRSPLKAVVYPISTYYIRCIWGWFLRGPHSQGYHHVPYESMIVKTTCKTWDQKSQPNWLHHISIIHSVLHLTCKFTIDPSRLDFFTIYITPLIDTQNDAMFGRKYVGKKGPSFGYLC